MYEYRVDHVHRVVDGDTIDCRISLGFGLSANFRFRLFGVDAPERYGPDASPEGQEATRFVEGWLAGRKLIVRTFKSSDKTVGIGDGAFGRWLADFIDAETGQTLAGVVGEKYGGEAM